MMSDYDLRYLVAAHNILETYLLSPDLYWLPGITAKSGETPYPSLTPGNILLAFARSEVMVSGHGESSEFIRQQNRFSEIKNHWSSAWIRKCTLDFRNRLDLWIKFLDELTDDPETNQDRYPFEVTRRVLTELLQREFNSLGPVDIQMVKLADMRLMENFSPGAFIWNPDLIVPFPKKTFWYLYGKIKI